MLGETPQSDRPEDKSKIDVSKLLTIVPPASEILGSKKKQLVEKRIRIKFDRSLSKPIVRIPRSLAQELGIKSGDMVEVVVAGKKKARFTADVVEDLSENLVIVYPDELEKQGVSDNSIATIRKVQP